MSKYIDMLNSINNNIVFDLKNDALQKNIPIIKDDSLNILLLLIKTSRYKKILEIGTAVGYSSIMMASINNDITIDTIEINEISYKKALANIKTCNLDKRINVINCDALNVDLSLLKKEYDLIFIDAAKAQYQKFFEKYSPLLSQKGCIFTDNLLFHGFVEKYYNDELTSESKNLKALVRKIDRYNNWLANLSDFDTTFYEIGDGIAVSIRK